MSDKKETLGESVDKLLEGLVGSFENTAKSGRAAIKHNIDRMVAAASKEFDAATNTDPEPETEPESEPESESESEPEYGSKPEATLLLMKMMEVYGGQPQSAAQLLARHRVATYLQS